MADTYERNGEERGVAHTLWANRNRILASTAALGFAAFAAGSLVPPIQRAAVRVSAPAESTARWDDAALRRLVTEIPQSPAARRPTIVAAWVDLIDQTANRRPDAGAQRRADGTLEVWAEDRSANVARSQAQALADRIVDGLEPFLTNASTPLSEPPPVATAPEPPRPVEPEPRNAPLEALDASVASARTALADAQARLAKQPPVDARSASRPPPGGGRTASNLRRELDAMERFARALPSASPADAPASLRESDEWVKWRNAKARRDAAAATVAELSRTLLDGHPRMTTVRLRLADLDAELDGARDRLASAVERRARALRSDAVRAEEVAARDAAAATARERTVVARADAEAEVAAARRTLDALLAAREASVRSTPVPAPETVMPPEPVAPVEPTAPPEPAQPTVTRSVTMTEVRPNIWPIVAGSAAFGFIASSLLAVFASPRSLFAPAAPLPFGRARPRSASPPRSVPVDAHPPKSYPDVTPADELIGGILASEISRVVIVPIGRDERPVAVEIVRRLSLRGSQVALVDLSERQLAARAMGLEADALGVSDMIAGEATFAEIARRDVATQAEVFGGGQAVIGEAAFLAMERRNVLEFIERNFEVVLVVCGELALETVKALLTPDAALVVTVDGEDEPAVSAGTRRLRAAGLADMILANARQLAA
ncbi:hypothetical protein [uncultured Aureimonas sp.]|uniref:hypothetical protein n=1 Tax=uncultured Aureimonas sp. TaxID=1604662 RepID=UPI0025F34199|nr:hypothetical protein [uncultured Aureimonas sp.]